MMNTSTSDKPNSDHSTLPIAATELPGRRLEKIHQHLAATLESSDTLLACMGPIACDLMEMCYTLKLALNEAMASSGSAAEALEEVAPAIKMYLKTVQQVERLAKLDLRLNETIHTKALLAEMKL